MASVRFNAAEENRRLIMQPGAIRRNDPPSSWLLSAAGVWPHLRAGEALAIRPKFLPAASNMCAAQGSVHMLL
jgi:hypothetical protein